MASSGYTPPDFAQWLIDHQPDEDENCKACGEEYPCGQAWAANKILQLRERESRRPAAAEDGPASGVLTQ